MSDGKPRTHTQDSHSAPWGWPQECTWLGQPRMEKGKSWRRTRCPVHLHLRGPEVRSQRGRGEDQPHCPPPHGPALPCWRLILLRGHASTPWLPLLSRASASVLGPPSTAHQGPAMPRWNEYPRGHLCLSPHQDPMHCLPNPRCASLQPRPGSHLPGGTAGSRRDEVGWDAMAPPQLPGDTPVPESGRGGEGMKEGRRAPREAVPGSVPRLVALYIKGLTHRMLSIQACHGPLMASGRIRRSPPQPRQRRSLVTPTAHVPLRPQQRLHHVLERCSAIGQRG